MTEAVIQYFINFNRSPLRQYKGRGYSQNDIENELSNPKNLFQIQFISPNPTSKLNFIGRFHSTLVYRRHRLEYDLCTYVVERERVQLHSSQISRQDHCFWNFIFFSNEYINEKGILEYNSLLRLNFNKLSFPSSQDLKFEFSTRYTTTSAAYGNTTNEIHK